MDGLGIKLSWWVVGISALVVLGLGLIGGWKLHAGFSGDPAPTPSTLPFAYDSTALRPGDWLTGTVPVGGIVYQEDTSKTDTFEVILPQYVRDTVFQDSPPRNVSYESPDITLGDITQRRYLNFLALPIGADGVPTLNVTPEKVTGNFYDPQDGRGITMTWDVPSYNNKIGVIGDVSTTISDATILSTNPRVFYQQKNRSLEVGYRLSNTPIMQGVTISLSLEKVLFRF